jgi:hypothetical protein
MFIFNFLFFLYFNIKYLVFRHRFSCLIFKKIKNYYFFKNKSFNLVFKDSGIWDFFLLYVFDYYFRLYFIYTIMYFSEYALIEKAS